MRVLYCWVSTLVSCSSFVTAETLLPLPPAVVVHLKPTGGAPVLKQLKFKVRLKTFALCSAVCPCVHPFGGTQVSGDRSFAFVAETVRKQLQSDSVVRVPVV